MGWGGEWGGEEERVVGVGRRGRWDGEEREVGWGGEGGGMGRRGRWDGEEKREVGWGGGEGGRIVVPEGRCIKGEGWG